MAPPAHLYFVLKHTPKPENSSSGRNIAAHSKRAEWDRADSGASVYPEVSWHPTARRSTPSGVSHESNTVRPRGGGCICRTPACSSSWLLLCTHLPWRPMPCRLARTARVPPACGAGAARRATRTIKRNAHAQQRRRRVTARRPTLRPHALQCAPQGTLGSHGLDAAVHTTARHATRREAWANFPPVACHDRCGQPTAASNMPHRETSPLQRST